MTMQFRALAPLTEDPGWFPPSGCSQPSVSLMPGDLVPFMGSSSSRHTDGAYTHMQANMYTYKKEPKQHKQYSTTFPSMKVNLKKFPLFCFVESVAHAGLGLGKSSCLASHVLRLQR